jgi:pantothenate kinase type III
MISLDALFLRASKLPRVEFLKPRQVIGKNTVESIQSGIYHGYAGLVDGIVHKVWDELGETIFTMATGGLAPLIAADSNTIEAVDLNLTLEVFVSFRIEPRRPELRPLHFRYGARGHQGIWVGNTLFASL